jgi:carbonic anhydrase
VILLPHTSVVQGSEHKINGKSGVSEMHIVTTHIEGTDELRVIGQIFRVGQQSSQLQTMLDANGKNDSVAVAYGKIFTGEYYTYAGHPHVLRLAAGAR